MNWYYADNGERKGPVDEAELGNLARAGRVTPETLVWREGLSDWQPYGSIGNASSGGAALATAAAGGQARCVECGQTYPTSEMVQYEGSYVCPNCKPIFFQKIKEGVLPTGQMAYGGFWIRFAAKIVDGIVLRVINFAVSAGLLVILRSSGSENAFALLNIAISMLIAAAYSIYFVGTFGATPGKMACRLKIVTATGGKVSYGRACGRYFAEILSSIILLIGYIMAAFDDEKRTLHDRICDTRVIKTNA